MVLIPTPTTSSSTNNSNDTRDKQDTENDNDDVIVVTDKTTRKILRVGLEGEIQSSINNEGEHT